MTVQEVHRVLDILADAGCRAWVAGGWGVDVAAPGRRWVDLALLRRLAEGT